MNDDMNVTIWFARFNNNDDVEVSHTEARRTERQIRFKSSTVLKQYETMRPEQAAYSEQEALDKLQAIVTQFRTYVDWQMAKAVRQQEAIDKYRQGTWMRGVPEDEG